MPVQRVIYHATWETDRAIKQFGNGSSLIGPYAEIKISHFPVSATMSKFFCGVSWPEVKNPRSRSKVNLRHRRFDLIESRLWPRVLLPVSRSPRRCLMGVGGRVGRGRRGGGSAKDPGAGEQKMETKLET
jgi:hypothetical protein